MPPTTRRAARSNNDAAPVDTAVTTRRSQRRKALGTLSVSSSNSNNNNINAQNDMIGKISDSQPIKKTRLKARSTASRQKCENGHDTNNNISAPTTSKTMTQTKSNTTMIIRTDSTRTRKSRSATTTATARVTRSTRTRRGKAEANADANEQEGVVANSSSTSKNSRRGICDAQNKSKKGAKIDLHVDTDVVGQANVNVNANANPQVDVQKEQIGNNVNVDSKSTTYSPTIPVTADTTSTTNVAPRRGGRQRKPTKRYIEDTVEVKEDEEIVEPNPKASKARKCDKASTRGRTFQSKHRGKNKQNLADTVIEAPRAQEEEREEPSKWKPEPPDSDVEEDSGEEDYVAPDVEDEEEESGWKSDPPDSESEEEDLGEEEWEEDTANNAWAKDAANYDSSLEEEFSSEEEEDSESDADDDGERVGWNSIRHRTGKMKKQKRKRGTGAGRPRKTFAKRRPIRKDVRPIPELSAEEKCTVLQRITHEKPGTTLVRKFLQCLLFDFDYRYTLLSHQFIGALGVSGIDQRPLSEKFVNMDEADKALLIDVSEKGKEYRRSICAEIEFVKTKGILLADDMGLGKTIQGLSGAVLRQAIQSIKSDVQSQCQDSDGIDKKKIIQKNMPTAIIGPNKDVLDQWEESLLMAGVPRARIKYFHPEDGHIERGNTFVLMTRYQLFSEIRSFMDCLRSNLYGYPEMSIEFVKMLKKCYDAGQSKITNDFKERDETESECIVRILRKYAHQIKSPMFRTILIDEAHFLKNLTSYWGMGTALLGMMSERSVPLSGTPYNNGPQDMATLMTFIDPFERTALYSWWENAAGNSNYVAKQVSAWRSLYLIRRDKSVLSVKLPPKIVQTYPVAASSNELEIYRYYEATFLKALKEFSKMQSVRTLEQRSRQKELFTVLMATMSCMRMCLIHPLIPGGREFTIRFSPSRRKKLCQFAKESSETCVCCSLHLNDKVQKKTQSNVTEQEMAALTTIGGAITEDEQMQDADFDSSGNGNRRDKNNKRARRESKHGKIVRLSSKYCRACDECPHYIHEDCLENMLKEDPSWTCPRCDDLESRLKVSQTMSTDRPIYCEHIVCGGERGIRASAKIHEVVKWAQALPKGEKAILYSFFKGGLDIVEGIFAEDLGIECARFDGDKTPDERSKELSRFKSSATCRILLASVQSSGVGLNIVEANHVAFLDRWFNPCVHAQAEDRCHRLKQTKEVKVTYFDTSMTVDEVMKSINDMKTNNASILLADGSDIGASQSGIKYRDLSGVIGDMMKAVEKGRKKFDSIHNSPDDAYIPIDEKVLIAAADQKEIYNKSRVKSDKHAETQDKKPVRNKKSLDTKDSTSVNVKQDATEKKDSTRVNLSEGTKAPASISSSRTQKDALSVGNEKIDALTIEKKVVAKIQPFTSEPIIRKGEYQVTLPVVTDAGLPTFLMSINSNEKGRNMFYGYRARKDGTKGPAEVQGLIKNIGDNFIYFDGVATSDMNFKEFLSLVKDRAQKCTKVRAILRSKHANKSSSFLANLDKSLDDLLSDDEGDKDLGSSPSGTATTASTDSSTSSSSLSYKEEKKSSSFLANLNKGLDDLLSDDEEEVNNSVSSSSETSSTRSTADTSSFESHSPNTTITSTFTTSCTSKDATFPSGEAMPAAAKSPSTSTHDDTGDEYETDDDSVIC